MLRLKKQSSQLTFSTFLTGTLARSPRSPLRHRTRRSKRDPGTGSATAGVPAKRTVFAEFPQRGENHARFALLANGPPRTLGTYADDVAMQILVTGASGYVGAALVPRLQRGRPRVRGFAPLARARRRRGRRARRAGGGRRDPGAGLERALDGVEVAYYLIHSMEGAAAARSPTPSGARRRAFAAAAAGAGVRRIVYLGGLVPAGRPLSRHLASRLAVEEPLLAAAPESIAMRASIVIGARSRSFRFLVRLIERMPVLALPAWRDNRTAPIDGRDMLEFLARAATAPARARRPVVGHRGPGRDDLRGARRADRRRHAGPPPRVGIDVTMTAVASRRGRRDRRRGRRR